jgi:hypothetical protein
MRKRKQLGVVLRERDHISQSALENALQEQKQKLALLGEILLKSGKVSKPDLVAALEEVSGVKYVDLETTPVDSELLQLLPRETAERHCAIPIARHGSKIRVAMAQPQNLAAVDELRFRLGADIEPCLAFREEIMAAMARYYAAGPEKVEFGATVELTEGVDPQKIEFFTSTPSQRHEEAIREFQRELRGKVTPAVHLVSAMLAAAAACTATCRVCPANAFPTLVGTNRISSACIGRSGALASRILFNCTGVSVSPFGPLRMIRAAPSLAVRVVPPANAIACSTVSRPLSISIPLGLPTSPTT